MSFSLFIREVPKLRGSFFGGSSSKDFSFLGVYIGVALCTKTTISLLVNSFYVQLAASNPKPELLNPET